MHFRRNAFAFQLTMTTEMFMPFWPGGWPMCSRRHTDGSYECSEWTRLCEGGRQRRRLRLQPAKQAQDRRHQGERQEKKHDSAIVMQLTREKRRVDMDREKRQADDPYAVLEEHHGHDRDQQRRP